MDNARERRDSLFEEHLSLEEVLEKLTIRVEKHSEKITGVSQRLQQYYTFGQEKKSDKHEMYRKKLGTKKAEKDIALKRYEKACVMKLSRIDGRERAEVTHLTSISPLSDTPGHEDHTATISTCHYVVHVSCGLICDKSDTRLVPGC